MNTVLVGAQWGDEGKGKVTDLIARDYDFVVRYQGGNNAGHTVIHGDTKLALHLMPSGVMYPDSVPVIGNGVVIDPGVLVKEMAMLQAEGISCQNLKISCDAHIIMPYHKDLDGADEKRLGANQIGTTKRGIGPGTVQKLTDYAAMHDGSLFGAAAKAVTNGIVAGKAGKELQKFCDMIEQYRVKLIDSGLLPAPDSNIKQTGDYSIRALIESIRDDTGYAAELQADGQVEAETRLQNIEEMINKAVSYEAEAETPHLGEFLEEVSLVSDLDRTDDTKDLLTMSR